MPSGGHSHIVCAMRTLILEEELPEDIGITKSACCSNKMKTNMIIKQSCWSTAPITCATILVICTVCVLANTNQSTDLLNTTVVIPSDTNCRADNKTNTPATTTTYTASCKSFQPVTTDQQASSDQELTEHRSGDNISAELSSFRMEYNKYKILSHLGITTSVDRITHDDLDTEVRKKLVATNAFQDVDDNNNGEGSRGISSTRGINLRNRRSLACSQVKSDKDACCMETLYVNFTDIGWDKWILYPTGYNANYCRGQCDLSHARYYHSTLLSKFSKTISLCCSPRQMSPLRLLYIDEENKVHQKLIPDMIVESCDCA